MTDAGHSWSRATEQNAELRAQCVGRSSARAVELADTPRRSGVNIALDRCGRLLALECLYYIALTHL